VLLSFINFKKQEFYDTATQYLTNNHILYKHINNTLINTEIKSKSTRFRNH